MALTLFTDTYATVATADANYQLSTNTRWTELEPMDKETHLKAATNIIDTEHFQGAKDDSAQALKFPRAFIEYGAWPEEIFITAEINARLANACCAQVAYMLAPMSQQQLKGRKMVGDKPMLSPEVQRLLQPYVARVKFFDDYRWEQE